jgi:hydrogenase maturation protease
MGEITAKILIVGCEPLDFGDALEGRIGLSEIVAASVPEATRMVLDLIGSIDAKKATDTGITCTVG